MLSHRPVNQHGVSRPRKFRTAGRGASQTAQLYHTYRPSGRGSSVVTTSEPDTSRVPDINSAGHAALATSSTPDLQRALQGIRAQHKQQRADSSGGRLDPLSIPEDVQVGPETASGCPNEGCGMRMLIVCPGFWRLRRHCSLAVCAAKHR